MQDQYFTVSQVENTTVIEFLVSIICEEASIRRIGALLCQQAGEHKIVVNFQRVTYLSATFLGELISFLAEQQKAGGRLILCGLDMGIYEIFELTRMNREFRIVSSVEEALAT